MYDLAATAAGVGMLALTSTAEARIVYTPTHQEIPPSTVATLFLDLNHDNITDFSFVNFYSTTSSMIALWVSHGNPDNAVYSHFGWAAALPAGVKVGPKGRFQRRIPIGMVSDDAMNQVCRGPWKNAHKRYLGLKFDIKGKTHFGWARLNVSCVYLKAINATLTGYAYETIPNRPIATGRTDGPDQSPKQVTLGHLAQGAAAISACRERPSTEKGP